MDRTTACLSHPIKLAGHGIGVVVRHRIIVGKAHVPDELGEFAVLHFSAVETPYFPLDRTQIHRLRANFEVARAKRQVNFRTNGSRRRQPDIVDGIRQDERRG